jgi:hypothetical protein
MAAAATATVTVTAHLLSTPLSSQMNDTLVCAVTLVPLAILATLERSGRWRRQARWWTPAEVVRGLWSRGHAA